MWKNKWISAWRGSAPDRLIGLGAVCTEDDTWTNLQRRARLSLGRMRGKLSLLIQHRCSREKRSPNSNCVLEVERDATGAGPEKTKFTRDSWARDLFRGTWRSGTGPESRLPLFLEVWTWTWRSIPRLSPSQGTQHHSHLPSTGPTLMMPRTLVSETTSSQLKIDHLNFPRQIPTFHPGAQRGKRGLVQPSRPLHQRLNMPVCLSPTNDGRKRTLLDLHDRQRRQTVFLLHRLGYRLRIDLG